MQITVQTEDVTGKLFLTAYKETFQLGDIHFSVSLTMDGSYLINVEGRKILVNMENVATEVVTGVCRLALEGRNGHGKVD